MDRFTLARKWMVGKQLRERDIHDPKVLKTMALVPRHLFVPESYQDKAYDDQPLPIGLDQTISQPYIVALMTQILELKGHEKVLEVGTGSGYQTAILARIAKKVYTIERHASLVQKAEEIFKKLDLHNIRVKIGDGSQGWSQNAPFEAIIVTAASDLVPPAFLDQLADGGRLVIPLGNRFGQELIRLTKKGKKIKKENFGGCIFVPLVT